MKKKKIKNLLENASILTRVSRKSCEGEKHRMTRRYREVGELIKDDERGNDEKEK